VKLATLLACVLMISACARIPEGMKQVTSSDRIVYRIPAESIDSKARYWGVEFNTRPYHSARAGFKFRRTAKVVPKDADLCEITVSSVVTPVSKKLKRATVNTSRTYVFEVEKWKKKGVATVQFTPLFEVMQPNPDTRDLTVSPPDTLESAMEVLATSGIFIFNTEIESSRNLDQISASFRRFCREQSHLQPVALMSRTFTTSYLLASGGRAVATFYVSLVPTTKGTKASVITKLPLAPDGNYQVDAVRQSADMRQVISDIINN
jgi:hypothetical protein